MANRSGSTHPFSNVALVAGFNTPQARVLSGHDSYTVALEAVMGLLDGVGISGHEVDSLYGRFAARLVFAFGAGPAHVPSGSSVAYLNTVIEAASAIAAGLCNVAVVVDGVAGVHGTSTSTALHTRPPNEFVVSYGMYTAVEFALIARRHMEMYGTTPEHLATVAATIRNNGHVNPDAIYFGRGPFTVDDVLSSRMIADPFHLLDCSTTSEGACAILLTTPERARELTPTPVYILGAGLDWLGPPYQHPPSWDLKSGSGTSAPNGYIGRGAARKAFAMAGLRPADVNVGELYDPFSFEIIRQLEAFEFCGEGDGPAFVMEGNIGPEGRFPVTTDGGTMSYSHFGYGGQSLQRVIRGMHQLQGTCSSNQVAGAEVALCSHGGAGALFTNVILLGTDRP